MGRYIIVPDQYKTQTMCKKAISENGRTLKSVTDCCKNQEIGSEAVYNYPHWLEFVLECYKTQKCVINLSILILLQ